MALFPHSGRHFFDDIEHMVNRAFDRRLVGDFFPTTSTIESCPMDLIEEPKSYVIKADAPGMDKGDIKLELRENWLTLSGERKTEKEEQVEGRFTRYERTHRCFNRTLKLPRDADGDNIEASLDKGVLSVSIPKKHIKEGSDVKRIEIK